MIKTFRTIFRYDLKLLWADRSLLALVGLLLLLLGFGAFFGSRFWHERNRAIETAIAATEEAFAEDRAKVLEMAKTGAEIPAPWDDPGSPMRRTYPATLPSAPLAELAIGQADLHPYWATVGLFSLPSAPYRFHEMGNPLSLLAGRFDLAFAFVFLFPLLVIALSYNLLSGEREQGTLALALSQPISTGQLIAGKVLSRGVLVLGLALGLAPLALVAAGADLGAQGALPRLAMAFSLLAVYALFWFALAVWVGALGGSSATNALTLAGAWIAIAIAAPTLVDLAANALHPAPSRLAFVAEMRRAENESNQIAARLLENFYGDHPELAPKDAPIDLNDFTSRYYAVRLDLDRRIAPLTQKFDASIQRQQALVHRWGRISPAIALHEAMLDLAGSGTTRNQRFTQQVRAFIQTWRAFFVPKTFRRERLSASDFDALPRFRFDEETPRELFARISGPLVSISVFALLFGVLGLRSLRRYRVAG